MLVHFSQSAFPRSSDLQPHAENSTIDPSLCFHLNAKFIKNAHGTVQLSRKNANLYSTAVHFHRRAKKLYQASTVSIGSNFLRRAPNVGSGLVRSTHAYIITRVVNKPHV